MKYVIEVFQGAEHEYGAKCWIYGSRDGEAMEHDAAEGMAFLLRGERPDLTIMVLPLRPAP